MRAQRVLVVDDEEKILRLLKAELTAAKLDVVTAGSGEQALELVETMEPDLIVLDLIMPGMDGLELIKELRAFSAVPVIVLSARDTDADKVRGLLTGADDYVTKPFNPNELTARVLAQLRRSDWQRETGKPRAYRHGELVVDFERNVAMMRGERILLTRTEWNLLYELASNPGRVMLHDELLERSWGPEYRGEVQYLRVWVSRLRKKLETGEELIKTIPGIGYMMAEPESSALPSA